jgi:hypothetical protein
MISPFYKKKLRHPYPVTQLAELLWQPGDPPAADPWLSVTRLLGVWRFHEQLSVSFTLFRFPEHAISKPETINF